MVYFPKSVLGCLYRPLTASFSLFVPQRSGLSHFLTRPCNKCTASLIVVALIFYHVYSSLGSSVFRKHQILRILITPIMIPHATFSRKNEALVNPCEWPVFGNENLWSITLTFFLGGLRFLSDFQCRQWSGLYSLIHFAPILLHIGFLLSSKPHLLQSLQSRF